MTKKAGVSVKTIQRALNEIDDLKYVGSGNSGHWEKTGAEDVPHNVPQDVPQDDAQSDTHDTKMILKMILKENNWNYKIKINRNNYDNSGHWELIDK